MFKNALIFAGAGLLMVFLSPFVLPMLNADPPAVGQAPSKMGGALPKLPLPVRANVAEGYRELALPADGRGQYSVDAYIDGVSVRFLVDTGASFVSISQETANRLGLTETPGSPHYVLETANGRVNSYGVKLPSLDLGSIYVKDVDAVVNPNMGGLNLLGANFLQRLTSVEQRGGELILRQ